MKDRSISHLTGIAAIAGPLLHLLTDLMELVNNGFSFSQLIINYMAFLIIPVMIIGLFAYQRPAIGWAGFVGALIYAFAFIYFSSTSLYAVLNNISDYETLLNNLGLFYYFNGALMVAGGLLFSFDTIRIKMLPRWAGILLLAGITVNLIVALIPVTPLVQIAGSIARNIAFAGMGVFILKNDRQSP